MTTDSPRRFRLLWVVRHGEREDNVDPNWRAKGSLPLGRWDDPPLSSRGRVQASEAGVRLADQGIGLVLCSPFSRCLETARHIFQELVARGRPLPELLVEPGICESLSVCESPPGFASLKEICNSFPELPIQHYSAPIMHPEKLLSANEKTNFCCFPRVINTLRLALKRYSGRLLIISHGSPIAAIHFALTGQLEYMGQCSISQYRIYDDNIKMNCENMPPMLLPRLGNSIVVKAEGQGLPNSRKEKRKLRSRRNTMPMARNCRKCRDDEKLLALTLDRIKEAGKLRNEVPRAECLMAGDYGHLSDQKDLHNLIFL